MPLYRHTCRGTFPGGETWSFGLYTQGEGAIDAAQSSWDTALGSMWSAGVAGLISTTVIMTETSTASITQATGQQITRVGNDVSRPGTATALSLPPQNTLAVSKLTALKTRSGRGRFYLPPFTVDAVATGGLVTEAARTAVVAGVAALVAGLGTGGLVPCLYGQTSHAVQPITGYKVGQVIDTQRRRRNKLSESYVPVS